MAYTLFFLFTCKIFLILIILYSFFQASQDKKSLDVGANLFVGNLDPVWNYHFIVSKISEMLFFLYLKFNFFV